MMPQEFTEEDFLPAQEFTESDFSPKGSVGGFIRQPDIQSEYDPEKKGANLIRQLGGTVPESPSFRESLEQSSFPIPPITEPKGGMTQEQGTALLGVKPTPQKTATAAMLGVPDTQGLTELGTALANQGISLFNFLKSPQGGATIGTAGLSPLAARLIAGAYGEHMAQQTPELAQQLGKATVEGSPFDVKQAALNLGGNTLLSALGLGNAATGAFDAIPKRSTETLPLAETPRDRQTVEQRVRDTETPSDAQKAEVQAQAKVVEPSPVSPALPTEPEATPTPPQGTPASPSERVTEKESIASKAISEDPEKVLADRKRYDEVQAEFSASAKQGKWPSRELMQENEDIKNRYGGHVPPTYEEIARLQIKAAPVLEAPGQQQALPAPPAAKAESSAQSQVAAPAPTEAQPSSPAIAETTPATGGVQTQGVPTPNAPISMGPGSAASGDVPPTPPIASVVESAAPENRPLGPVHPVVSAIHGAWQAVKDFVKGAAGESMPKTTSVNRELGEAGVRYASSRIAARPLATLFANQALEGTGVDPVKFGAALTEDNLRSVRESLRAKVTELMSKGDQKGADAAREAADKVVTIIGQEKSPFKTEDEYFDYLSRPDVQQAIKQHAQLWKEIIEPQYKQARDIDPNVELPTRGQQTGARINLKAVLPEDAPTFPVQGSPSLTGTFKRRTPFSIKAKGTGQTYDVNYHDLIANTFERQLEIANKNAFDDMLVKTGNAVIDAPGQRVMINGNPAVAFPLSRRVVTAGGESFSQAKNIYVRGDLANEYRAASNVDPRFRLPLVTPVFNVLNKAALAGLTDASVHASNLATALFNRPTSGKLFGDTLLSLTGRADVPVTLVKAIGKAFSNNQAQIAELSKIGAMRPHEPSGFMGRMLRKIDQTSRLVLDDTFKSLVEEGLVEDTETNRREYVNQVGQYNRRLQGQLTRLLRDTGLGPFATAGKTFNALGVKMVTMSPGAKDSTPLAAVALRANVLSKWVGASVVAATLNYLYTGKLAGRPGTPIGNIDLNTNDSSGKQQSFPFFNLIGLGRGLRVTGIRGAMESKRLGLSDADAVDAAARDIVNAWTAPAAGPPVKAAFIAASGFPPAVKVGRVSRVAPPGQSQLVENLKSAAIEANPLISSMEKYREGKPVSEVISSQLPRLSMSPGKTERMVKDYPRIVDMARANEFTEDVIYQARRMPLDKRRDFVIEQIQRLPPQARSHALREVARRRVYQP